jgi:hypothetical protein
MRSRSAFALGLLVVCAAAGAARAQEAALLPAPVAAAGAGAPGTFSLVPDATGMVFKEQLPPGLEVHGTADGLALNLGTGLEIGFDFVRPLWTFRDFTLAVPGFARGGFPLLADAGHTDDHFGFVPRLDLNYRFADSDLGLGASGSYLSLSGNLQRNVVLPQGVALLSATSSLTLATANLLEVTFHVDAVDLFAKQKDCPKGLEDVLLDVSLGARYSSLDQNYTGSLSDSVNGVAVTTRSSSQSFQGFGLTSSATASLPEGENWLLFSRLRGSVLVGENIKRSTLTVDVPGFPGLPNTISDDTTEFIPVLETEIGVVWGTELNVPVDQREKKGLSYLVKASFIADYWADVGPLSAGSTQAFRSSDLFLLGASLMVGVQR